MKKCSNVYSCMKFSRYIRIREGKLIIGNRLRNLSIKEWKSIQSIYLEAKYNIAASWGLKTHEI